MTIKNGHGIYLNTQPLKDTAKKAKVKCGYCEEILPTKEINIDTHTSIFSGKVFATVWTWCDNCGESDEILDAEEVNGKWKIEVFYDKI